MHMSMDFLSTMQLRDIQVTGAPRVAAEESKSVPFENRRVRHPAVPSRFILPVVHLTATFRYVGGRNRDHHTTRNRFTQIQVKIESWSRIA